MERLTKEKGITLIALIITIIVMLILVAVTISVALNGGLFDKAKDASAKTQREANKEELITTFVGAYDSSGSFNKNNVTELPEDTKWCTASENYENATNDKSTCDWVVTKSNEKYYVGKNGGLYENPWREWGLTSENVVFDSTYSGTSNTQGPITICFNSDGTLDVSWNPTTITKEDIESTYLNTMSFCKGDKWIILPGPNLGYAFVFEPNGEMTAYFSSTPDLNDLEGSIIDNGVSDGTASAS